MTETRLVQVGWTDTNVPGDPVLYTMSSESGRRHVPVYVAINVQPSEEEISRLITTRMLGRAITLFCFVVLSYLIYFGNFAYAALAVAALVVGILLGAITVIVDLAEKR